MIHGSFGRHAICNIEAELDEPQATDEQTVAIPIKGVKQPTREEKEWHESSHAEFAEWCVPCVLSRARDDAHKKRTVENEQQIGHCTVQKDYFFMKSRRDGQVATFTSAVDSFWGRCRATRVEMKGSRSEHTVKWLINFCKSLGVDKLIIRSDPENACGDVINAVIKELPWCMPQSTVKGNRQGLGRAEGMHGILGAKARTWMEQLKLDYRLAHIPVEHPIVEWLVRHVACLHERFGVGRDNLTPYKRHMLRDYPNQIVKLGETVNWRQPGPIAHKLDTHWGYGIWLGRCHESDGHIIGSRRGWFVVRAVRRLPPADRFDVHFAT